MAYGGDILPPCTHTHARARARTLFQLTSGSLRETKVLVPLLPALTPKGLAPPRGPQLSRVLPGRDLGFSAL